MHWHILIVDDDPQIGELTSEYLVKHGFKVSTARDGREMQRQLKKYSFDLIVLDVMLPGEDGLLLCKKLRQTSAVPIIMLSAMGEETDRIVGLEVGADDYLTKPFNPRELLARIKALARRASGEVAKERQAKSLANQPSLKFNDWTLDRNKRRLIDKDGVAVPLSAGEYELLLAFIEHPRRVLTRDQLLDLTRGREALPFDRSIDVQVARLRKKIEDDAKNPSIIVTVRGGGYQVTTCPWIEAAICG
jgi:two-component system, OmpR family, response regulator